MSAFSNAKAQSLLCISYHITNKSLDKLSQPKIWMLLCKDLHLLQVVLRIVDNQTTRSAVKVLRVHHNYS